MYNGMHCRLQSRIEGLTRELAHIKRQYDSILRRNGMLHAERDRALRELEKLKHIVAPNIVLEKVLPKQLVQQSVRPLILI